VSASNPAFGTRSRAGVPGSKEPVTPRSWIGVDLSAGHGRRRMRALLPLLFMAAVAALAIAALRIDLIRVRYAVAAVMEQEEALLEEQRSLIVRRRQLRDPVELAVRARELGFRPAAEVLALPEPTSGAIGFASASAGRSSVAAGAPIEPKRSVWR
jgi:hypothetical protein